MGSGVHFTFVVLITSFCMMSRASLDLNTWQTLSVGFSCESSIGIERVD